MNIQMFECMAWLLNDTHTYWMYVCARVNLCLCSCKLSQEDRQAGRQAGCVLRWYSKALYVCVCVCMEQVCLAALHSLLPICAPVCVPPVPTLCQQHHTIARRPRRMGCWEMRGGMESKQETEGGRRWRGSGVEGADGRRSWSRRERQITRQKKG